MTGRVTGADDGLPLPQVTVLLKGTTQGTPTDADGNYRLSVPSNGGTLVFRYLGYVTQEVAIGAKTIINVQLVPDTQTLGEVVVTAYGEDKRATISSSISTVGKERINAVPIPSLDQVLQGQAAGVNIQTQSGQPGASAFIQIRGRSSINGNNEPLFMIDGIPVDEDNFRSLNPNDIESVNILKDASASALYGNKAAGGVILITTKRGNENQDGGININYQFQYGQTNQVAPNFEMMNSAQLIDLQQQLNTGFGAGRSPGGGYVVTDAEIAAAARETTDWTDVFFRTGTTQSHDINISTGNQKTQSYTSIGYFTQEGTTVRSDLTRYTFRNNFTTNFSDKLKMSTNLTLNYSESNFPQNPGSGQLDNPFINPFIALPFYNPNNDDGSRNLQGTAYSTANGTNTNGFLNTPYITLSTNAQDTQVNDRVRIIGNGTISYQVTDNINVGGDIGMDFFQTQALNITSPLSIRGIITPDENALIKGSQNESTVRDRSITTRAYVKYNTIIKEDHFLDVSLFTEYYNRQRTAFSFTGFGIDPKLIGSGAGLTPGITAEGPNETQFYIPGVGSSEVEVATFSYFGVLKYNFKETYGGQLSIRRDASSRFNTTNKWGTFWSASAYWNAHNNVLSDIEFIDQAKLRVSYGITGNERISGGVFGSAFASFDLFGRGGGYQNSAAYFPAQIGNPDLKWETTAQLDVGLDFSLWQGKLTGTIDYYYKNTEDLFLNQPISLTSGFGSIQANVGSMENRGLEFTFDYEVFSSNDLRISVNANAAYNQNEITALAGDDFILAGGGTALSVGDPFGSLYRVRYVGVNPANGDPLYLDTEGNVTDQYTISNRVLLDKTNQPLWVGGFGTFVSYKGFTFTTQWSYAADQWRLNGSFGVVNDVTLAGFANQSTNLLNAWQNPGDISTFPRLTYRGIRQEASDLWLEDASFVRLRNATLAYDFSRQFLSKTGFLNSVRVYVQGQNLWTSTKWRGFDPENTSGTSFFEYPTSRVWTVGVNVGL